MLYFIYRKSYLRSIFSVCNTIYCGISDSAISRKDLSTEYPVPGKSGSGQISSIFADIVLRIAGSDIYHLECQMEKEDCISVRMFEYDVNISLLYGLAEGVRIQDLHFPASIILYLGTNSRVPDKERCRIIMNDKSEIDYTVPVIKVQDYSLQKIKENHLTIFLPYTFLRFRSRLRTKKNKVTQKELTVFVKEIILILKYELSEGNITYWQYNDYINYICMAVEQVFAHYPKLYKEVLDMTYSEFFMEIDVDRLLSKRLRKRITNQIKPGLTAEIRAEVTAEIRDEVTAKVTDEVTAKVTAQIAGEWAQKLADARSENEKLRALLRTHGIKEGSLVSL